MAARSETSGCRRLRSPCAAPPARADCAALVSRRLAATSLAGGLVAAAVAGGIALADADRRNRLHRSARVWRLTARRSAHYAVVKVRGARADEERESGPRAAVRDPHRRGRRPRAGQHEGRHHEGGPADRLHRRRPPSRSAGGARHAAGRRAAHGAVARGGGRPQRARRRAQPLLPRLEPDPGGGGLRRPGAPGRPARWPRGRGEGAVPGRRSLDPIRSRQRRDALQPVLLARVEGARRQGAGRRAAGSHVRRARLPHRGREPGRRSGAATAAIRSFASPRSCPSCRRSECSSPSGSTV